MISTDKPVAGGCGAVTTVNFRLTVVVNNV